MADGASQRAWLIGGGVAGAAVAGVAAWWFTRTETPAYSLVLKDGAIEVRAYGTLPVAEAVHDGERDAALGKGFRALADYIFARSRGGEKIAMTAPVIADRAGDGWRTRFVLPAQYLDLAPPAPATDAVRTMTLAPRRVAAIRFAGRADDALLAEREAVLREWLSGYGLKPTGPAEYAFYNAPLMPGPLRRSEVLLPVSSIY
ncbi:hypothetical protein COC42_15640 [Sphingomonas spermidinifaciens]|uniref:Heme-binding protein n=1 Tax=Sphingomonas spermidinifaciens TaxID=1141889 RepID=A0A2A4B0T2_9SPHN|nr:heme-binding protein [Sphingomonas spermidinifaciens]PCD01562.1 hypothetical protein COC42_15640 [Sphingomonas spermidinifaciens]